jgi:hypothetical protein
MMANSHLSSEPKITQDSAEQCHAGEGKDATESRFEGYGLTYVTGYSGMDIQNRNHDEA